jgi:hypothetical protein
MNSNCLTLVIEVLIFKYQFAVIVKDVLRLYQVSLYLINEFIRFGICVLRALIVMKTAKM